MLKMDLKLDEVLFTKSINTPLGSLKITTNKTQLVSIAFNNNDNHLHTGLELPIIMTTVEHQLGAYFNKSLIQFNIPMAPKGTEFQHLVWERLQQIEYGKTISYQQLAEQMGNRSKTRAVASATAKNPILIVIPCHRVIGTDGRLTGYSGGIDNKRELLIHEGFLNHKNSILF